MTPASQSDVNITLYADDTVLYTSSPCPRRASVLLNDGLQRLSKWCIENKLTINVKKTKHMKLTPPGQPIDNEHIMLKNEPLDVVHSYDYLGVVIDDDMTFEGFLNEKCKKVNVRIYQLGKLRKYVTSDIACLIYKQTILPIVEYADLLVESGPLDKVARLQRLQEKAVRIIDNRNHIDLDVDIVSNLFRITPLKIRRAEHLSLMMYRLKDDHLLIDHSRPNVHLRGRNKIKFKIYKRQKEKYLRNPVSRGITMWNRIPERVQRSTTKVKFKREIKPYLTDLIMPVLR